MTSLDGINGWSIQTLLRGENDSKQSDEIQAISMFYWIIFLIFLDCLSRYFSYRFAGCRFQPPYMNIAYGLLKMPRVSNEFDDIKVKCERKLFRDLILLLLIQTLTGRTASLALSKIQNWLGQAWADGWFWRSNKKKTFSNALAKPIIIQHTI